MPALQALFEVGALGQRAYVSDLGRGEHDLFQSHVCRLLSDSLARLPGAESFTVGVAAADGRGIIGAVDEMQQRGLTVPSGTSSRDGSSSSAVWARQPLCASTTDFGTGFVAAQCPPVPADPDYHRCMQVRVVGFTPTCLCLGVGTPVLQACLEMWVEKSLLTHVAPPSPRQSSGRKSIAAENVAVHVVLAGTEGVPVAEWQQAVSLPCSATRKDACKLEVALALPPSGPSLGPLRLLAFVRSVSDAPHLSGAVASAALLALPQTAATEVLYLLEMMDDECKQVHQNEWPATTAAAMISAETASEGYARPLHLEPRHIARTSCRIECSTHFQDFCRDMGVCLGGTEPEGLLAFLQGLHMYSTLDLCEHHLAAPAADSQSQIVPCVVPPHAAGSPAHAHTPASLLSNAPPKFLQAQQHRPLLVDEGPANYDSSLSNPLSPEQAVLHPASLPAAAVSSIHAPVHPAGGAGGPTTGPPPRLTLSCVLVGFPHSIIERDYVRHKHAAGEAFDYYGACFASLYFLALVVRLLREDDVAGNVGIMLYISTRVLPFVPLAVSRRWFSAHREALMAASEAASAALVALKLLWPGVAPTPTARMETFWRFHLELIVYGLVKPICHHTRFPLFAVLVLIAWLTVVAAFTMLRPVQQAALHFAPGCLLGLLLGLYFEFRCRRAYVRHCEEAQRVTAAKNAAADTSAAGRASSDDDGAAWEGGPGTSSSAAAPAKHKAE